MIAACETQDFVPFGREYIHHHPGHFQLQVQNTKHAEHGLHILKIFRDSPHEAGKKEQWLFRHHEGEGEEKYDEELYVSDRTVVWSKGGQNGVQNVLKTFTVDSPVVQALWGTFILSGKDKNTTPLSSVESTGTVQKGICVIESTSTLSFFKEDGGEYLTALPFQVSQAWPIKNGLLFERCLAQFEYSAPKKNAPNQTIVFSMLHPLEEVAPVITKTSGAGGCPKINYLTDNTQHILFTNIEPSIAFTYDTMLGLHSAWRIRRARQEECCTISGYFDTGNASFSHLMPTTPVAGLNQSSSTQSRFRASPFINSPNVSPLRTLSGKLSTPSTSTSRSPSLQTMAAVSRSQSPAVGANSMRKFLSPVLGQTGGVTKSPNVSMRTPSGPHNLSLIPPDSYSEWVEPLQPEICLEHLWTEPTPTMRDGSLGKASKVFLTKDMCGQQFICYMVPYKQHLRLLKFEESNDLQKLISGSLTFISAKDAVPIESLDLLVVLEPGGFLNVYSGTTKISQLHIPFLPLNSGSLSLLRPMTPLGSPTRGIFTSSRPASAMDARFDEEISHLSPVQTDLEDSSHIEGDLMAPQCNTFIQNMRDNVDNRFTIELLNGNLCRTTLPALSTSPGIDLCLKALKHLLPKDIALQVLGRWYTARNIPGGLGNQSEWSLFYKSLLGMMGYDTSRLSLTSKRDLDTSMSPVMSAKRSKPSEIGSEQDWEYLVNSTHHQLTEECSSQIHNLTDCELIPDRSSYSKPCTLSTTALLFQHCPAVMLALHLIYEEMKLNILLGEELKDLSILLYQIASDLQCQSYIDYYCRDFPSLFHQSDDVSQVTDDHLCKMQYPHIFPRSVPSVHLWIYNQLHGRPTTSLPYIPFVTDRIKNIISLYAIMLNRDISTEQAIEKSLRRIAPAGHRAPTAEVSLSHSFQLHPVTNIAEKLVLTMTELGIISRDLEYLPVGIVLPLREAILNCRCNPPSDWPEKAYSLIGREDLKTSLVIKRKHIANTENNNSTDTMTSKDEVDGMESLDFELLKLRFSEDLRIQEVRRLLQSSQPAKISLVQKPEVSDHDFIEEKEKHLYCICIRTMALPIGRGMLTLCTYHPLPTETLPIPKLCLTGRALPRNTTVELTHIDTPAKMAVWPHFHNGVAAGLRIANSTQVDSAWIIYNSPVGNDMVNEYAGFLMALGLNGHLLNLETLNVHDYLSLLKNLCVENPHKTGPSFSASALPIRGLNKADVWGQSMTTIGLILGLSAAKRGTMDLGVTRMLSIHLTALLPPTSTDLNIPHDVQVAGILGVGLVYQGTGNLHFAEVLLAEIGRPPGPENQNCTDRESYALASGLALGLVMFGKGKQAMGLSDNSMANILCHFMVGGQKRPLPGPYRERYNSPSYLIKEGDCVNIDVTAPGATLALGMFFFNTNNSAVAEWLKAPDTQFMLNNVQPDFLMLRTLSRGLVLWDAVVPTQEWVSSNIPEIVSKYAFKENVEINYDVNIDYETMSQAYCSLITGAFMVLGLKFAGSANQMAFDLMMEQMKLCLRLISVPALVEMAGKSLVENCLCSILLSLSMVMCGTGDLRVLRLCRMLRKRVGLQHVYTTYGSHMAISMATGLLFLGGGKYSLKTTPDAIGVMLCAFYPRFPTHSNDNRYHLQAFRHLYVLAAEPRLILPRDVDTGLTTYVPVQIKFKPSPCYKTTELTYDTYAPCLLPELHLLEQVNILGPRYWPVLFHVDKNWSILKSLLENNQILSVKQRAGHLSYVEDPQGYRSILAKSLTSDHSNHGVTDPEVIKSFTSDNRITTLSEIFLTPKHSQNYERVQELSSVLFDCVTQEKTESISCHLILQQLIQESEHCYDTFGINQLKLILGYYTSCHRLPSTVSSDTSYNILETEFLLGLKSRLEDKLTRWQKENTEMILKYIKNKEVKGEEIGNLSSYLTWFDFPSPNQLATILSAEPSLPVLCSEMKGLSVSTARKILATVNS
ncbi:hypothetical protein LOTGIDRAFT_232653 [Lottia gigantea]|uniref:Uncharacterized protein n=1 Tax=Lottia gigantea TaxID=225164 RepID=V4AEN9_LOTGI|nr:hypothetical protein LOTGIDRAFT_232653 [Lottia gigantea]ESO93615.1 hypothetical protein LOTGIDRAFT_232653 [Lottia gigantea]